MRKKYIIVAGILSAVVLGGSFSPLTLAAESTTYKQVIQVNKTKYQPAFKLGVTVEQFVKEKGNGKKEYGVNASGKSLSSIKYKEKWFGMKNVETIYNVDNNKIVQATLYFEKKQSYKKIINQVSKSLGKPKQQGKSEKNAPSEYFAHWEKGNLQYDLQYYGGYTEIYVTAKRK